MKKSASFLMNGTGALFTDVQPNSMQIGGLNAIQSKLEDFTIAVVILFSVFLLL